MNISQNIIRGVLSCLGLLAIFLLIVWGCSLYRSKCCYDQGVAYLDRGQYIKAVTYFDRSVHWYTPFNPYVRLSAENLWQISKDAESRGDLKLALIAVRTIRRGFYSARSFYLPGKEWIEKCDKRIEPLLARQQGGNRNETIGEGEGAVEAELQNHQPGAPDPFWSIILLLGLLGWIGSVIGFILKGLQKDGHGFFMIKPKLKWVALGVPFFVLWIVGMMRA